MSFLLLALALAMAGNAEAKPAIPVRIDFVEALAPRDTTSSVRYQQSYEGTIQLASELLGKKLEACGYRFDTRTAFYDASDALKAKEFATSSASAGAWMIVGPRRSNHYLLLVQGAEAVPSVSIMASSDKIADLGARHVSVSPVNSKMAAIAAREAKTRTKKAASYVAIVSSDCSNCVDFGKSFDQAAKAIGLRKLEEISLTGETVQGPQLRERVSALRPDFILLPNYSKVSSAVMASFNDEAKPPLFVGGDGWGDSQYGFVQNGLDVQKVKGITVRGFPPAEKGLALFPLGREILKTRIKGLTFTPDLSILKVMDETVAVLCATKPKARESFREAFERSASARIAAPWGVSVFELNRGEILFGKTVGKAR